jgi:protein-disulfide isomerase
MLFNRLFITTASIIAISSASLAADPAPTLTKEDVQAIVKDTLMDDPEIIMRAMEKLRAQKAEQTKKNAKKGLETYKTELYEDKGIPTVGASDKDADVTLIEFFDYHCGYCKHFLPEVNKLIAEDKKVRVRFIDFPILSEDSKLAAKAAVAVHRINKAKYFEYHSALMKEKGKFDEKGLLDLGSKIGIKPEKLKEEMNSPETQAQLDKNRKLAQSLGITGTPGIIVGSEVIPGAMQYEELKKVVEKARAEAKNAKAEDKKDEKKE